MRNHAIKGVRKVCIVCRGTRCYICSYIRIIVVSGYTVKEGNESQSNTSVIAKKLLGSIRAAS
jgi:hypothetical protein